MQAEQADGAAALAGPWAPACVAVLCGLPGAGKSTLARALRDHAAGWRLGEGPSRQ